MEIDLIAKYNTQNPCFGYNLTAGGDGSSGYTKTEETRRKLSVANKGKRRTEEQKARLIGNKYNLGNKRTEESKQKMSAALKGKRFSEEHKAKLSESHKERWRSEEAKTRQSETMNRYKKAVYQYSADGELIKVWDCLSAAMNGFRQKQRSTAISQCVAGRINSAYGYIWSYCPLSEFPVIQRQRKVYQYDKFFNLVKEWDSLFEAVHCFREGCKSTVINQCVSGHRTHAYGFVWSYSTLEGGVS